MNIDLGEAIGLIGVITAAGVLLLSYLGAYLVGHSRGRREAELAQRERQREESHVGQADRVLVVEDAISSMSQAVERLSELQRLSLLERSRASSAPELHVGGPRPKHNTPA